MKCTTLQLLVNYGIQAQVYSIVTVSIKRLINHLQIALAVD